MMFGKSQKIMVFDKSQENPTLSTYTLPNLTDEENTTPFLLSTSKPNHPPLSSLFKTYANVFISIVGVGVLGLPYTFKKTSWLMGFLILFSVAALTYHYMMLLIQTRRKLNPKKIDSFSDLGYSVCGSPSRSQETDEIERSLVRELSKKMEIYGAKIRHFLSEAKSRRISAMDK